MKNLHILRTLFYTVKQESNSWASGYAFVSGARDRISSLWPVKSDAVLLMARHHRDISLKGAVLPAGVVTRRRSRQLITRFGVIQRV